jgi:hypothetical protein
MPVSLDRQPADNEIECANCGALIYYELTRCPNCGVNLYEPEAESEQERSHPSSRRKAGGAGRLREFFRRLRGKPTPAEELFGAFVQQQAELYDDLLHKVGGDLATVERLVEFEHRQAPKATRAELLCSAIRRWEQDNQKL